MLRTKTIAEDRPGFTCRLKVQEATTGMGLFRSSLVDDGLRSNETNPLIGAFLWLQWPVLRAGTIDGHISWSESGDGDEPEKWESVSIDELTPWQVLDHVPEDVSIRWIEAILELNPRWVYRSSEQEKADRADPVKKKED